MSTGFRSLKEGQAVRVRVIKIEDLAGQATFEEVVYLLWYGVLPTTAQLDAFVQAIEAGRSLSEHTFASAHETDQVIRLILESATRQR